jgi:hypothetical protein
MVGGHAARVCGRAAQLVGCVWRGGCRCTSPVPAHRRAPADAPPLPTRVGPPRRRTFGCRGRWCGSTALPARARCAGRLAASLCARVCTADVLRRQPCCAVRAPAGTRGCSAQPTHACAASLLPRLQGVNTEHILKTRGLTKHFTISQLLVRGCVLLASSVGCSSAGGCTRAWCAAAGAGARAVHGRAVALAWPAACAAATHASRTPRDTHARMPLPPPPPRASTGRVPRRPQADRRGRDCARHACGRPAAGGAAAGRARPAGRPGVCGGRLSPHGSAGAVLCVCVGGGGGVCWEGEGGDGRGLPRVGGCIAACRASSGSTSHPSHHQSLHCA